MLQSSWRVNGTVIDATGEHDLSPKSDDDWEQIVSAAATLAESTNALMIPQRVRDRDWNSYVKKLADAANNAYLPGTSVETIGATIGKWYGVNDTDLGTIFPNLTNFPRDLGFLR